MEIWRILGIITFVALVIWDENKNKNLKHNYNIPPSVQKLVPMLGGGRREIKPRIFLWVIKLPGVERRMQNTDLIRKI